MFQLQQKNALLKILTAKETNRAACVPAAVAARLFEIFLYFIHQTLLKNQQKSGKKAKYFFPQNVKTRDFFKKGFQLKFRSQAMSTMYRFSALIKSIYDVSKDLKIQVNMVH